jgi:hypothetical protein
MDFFDMLASTPPRGKKQKIGEHGESPQLTPDMKKLEGAHSMDVKNDVFEEEHGPVLKKGERRGGRRAGMSDMPVEQRLKKWGLDKEFTVRGGSRLGCITCMKYGAWCEQEGADMKKKQKKKKEMKKKKKEKKEKKKKKPLLMHEVHTEEVKSPRKSHGPEADSGDEETTPADTQHALQKGTYKTRASRLKYRLERHLSGSQHKTAAGAREDEENAVKDQDVPSDAQMMFVYDEVKKSPMVPPLPQLPRGYYGYYGLIA